MAHVHFVFAEAISSDAPSCASLCLAAAGKLCVARRRRPPPDSCQARVTLSQLASEVSISLKPAAASATGRHTGGRRRSTGSFTKA